MRDIKRDKVEKLYQRVLKNAEGAAIATETSQKVNLFTGVHEVLPNEPLLKEIQRNLDIAGPISYTEQEITWAKTMQRSSEKEEKGLDGSIQPFKDEIPAKKRGGSTDVAEVSYIVPTSGFSATTAPMEIPWHSWQAASSNGTSIGLKGADFAARVLALTGVELFVNKELLAEAKKDFDSRTEGKAHRSPIPIDQKPPVPNR